MPLIPRRRRRSRDATMTVIEHLEEVRKRVLISLVEIGLAATVVFVLYRPILELPVDLYNGALRALGLPEREGLVFLSPAESFLTFLKVGCFAGLLIALPVVLYQLWRFISPRLTRRERSLALPFVLISVLLFAGGTAFAFMILPRALAFLFSFGGENLQPFLTADRYLSFLIFLILAFGLSFEFPLVLIFLSGARLITTQQMRAWRPYVYFGTAVFAAVITPTGDPYTMLLMWIPLNILYEAAILIARLFKR